MKLQTTRLPFTKAKAAVLINVKPVCQNLVKKIMVALLNKIILMKLVWSRPGQGIGTNYLKLKWRPNQSPRKGEGNVDLGYRSADAGAAWGHAPGVALSKRSSIDYVEINYRATTMFSFLSLWLLSSLPHLPPPLHYLLCYSLWNWLNTTFMLQLKYLFNIHWLFKKSGRPPPIIILKNIFKHRKVYALRKPGEFI